MAVPYIFNGQVGEVPALEIDLDFEAVSSGFLGAWNANTNTPTLASSVGTQGDKYLVSVAGTTNLNGITTWQVNDTALFNGSVWQRVPSTSTYAPAGTNPTGGGANATPSLKFLPWPLGSNDGTPGFQIGGTPAAANQSGFGGATSTLFALIQGEEIAWINLAQTWGLGRYNRGGIINSVCWYPGAVKTSLNSFRFQNADSDADFRTDGSWYQNVSSSVAFHFNANTTSGNATINSLTFDPTTDGLNYVGTTLVEHSNGAVDVVAGTVIDSFTSTKFTMHDAAINNAADADFSINITAPSGHSSLGTYLTPLHIPFVGTLTAGSKDITSLKFNPQRVGIPTMGLITETSNGGVDFPADSRVANYTDTTITVGDAVTGQPVNAANNRTAATFSIETGFGPLTCTGDLSSGSPVITNLSINPIATPLPTGATVGGGFDRPQWTSTSGVFTSSARVLSITSTSITFNQTAQSTNTALGVKIQCSRTSMVIQPMCSGTLEDAIKVGWIDSLYMNAVQIPSSLPVYYRSTQILDTSGNYIGPITTPVSLPYAASATGTDAYAVTLTGVTEVTGRRITVQADVANVGNATLELNSSGHARNIKKAVSTTLSSNDVLAGMMMDLVYDGTQSPVAWILLNPRTL